MSYINACCGLTLSPDDICRLLTRMSYQASSSRVDSDIVAVQVPPTRADVLHQCDVMEDVAVAYGFNNLPRTFPGKSGTIAQPLMVNKLSDIVRLETAMAGWSEVMPLSLCSHDENFAWLNREDDGTTAVKLANPKTAEYQIVRTSLLPGLLKTIRENKHHSVPIKVFEVSDIALKDLSLERKSRNERHFAAAWCGKTSGFEMIHGLLDRIMAMLKATYIKQEHGLEGTKVDGYWIEEAEGKSMAEFTSASSSSSSVSSFLHPLCKRRPSNTHLLTGRARILHRRHLLPWARRDSARTCERKGQPYRDSWDPTPNGAATLRDPVRPVSCFQPPVPSPTSHLPSPVSYRLALISHPPSPILEADASQSRHRDGSTSFQIPYQHRRGQPRSVLIGDLMPERKICCLSLLLRPCHSCSRSCSRSWSSSHRSQTLQQSAMKEKDAYI